MAKFDNQLLVIPEKPDVERDEVARVWQENGGQVLSLGRFWEPPLLDPTQVRLYGAFDSFAATDNRLSTALFIIFISCLLIYHLPIHHLPFTI